MVWVLEDEGNAVCRADVPVLRGEQSSNETKKSALAAAIAADQHPEAWPWNAQIAVMKSLVAIRP